MAMTLEYALDLNHRLWLPVPLRFPWNDYTDAEGWADAVAEGMLDELIPAVRSARPGADAAEVRELLRATALASALAPPPLPDPSERFWYLPREGREAIVHLYVSEYQGGTGQDDFVALAVAGVGGTLHSAETLTGTAFDTAFDTAARTIVLVEGSDPPAVVLRLIGIAVGAVSVLEFIHPDPSAVAEVLPALEQLFGSIRMRRV